MVVRTISGIFEPVADFCGYLPTMFSEDLPRAAHAVSPYLEPVTDTCYDLLIEPYCQGYYNLRDAAVGTKAASVAQSILNPHAPQREISLLERVNSAVVGILLIIPIINTIVMTILRGLKSDLLYPTKASDIQGGAITLINDPPTPPINTDPISPEEMVARKRAALAKLATLETMIRPGQDALAELNNHFRPHSQVHRFNLDAVLERYQTTHTPAKLFDFIDWAGIRDAGESDRFRWAINRFDNQRHSSRSQEETIRNLLCKMAEYFEQQQARVGTGTPEETALKEQFARVYSSIIDANNNCADQTLAQVQTLLLDVVAEGDAASNGGSAQAKIINRAGLALCKYRSNLLREILIRQNPDNHHMADLERAVTQRLAGVLGMQGNIFEAGAVYNFEANLEGRVDRALQAFREEYKPFEHLVGELRTYHGAYQSLRNAILIWATGYYGFADETGGNLPDGTAAPDIEAPLSEDPDNILSDGGNFNCPGLVLMLDTLGLICPTTAQPTA